MKMLKSKLFELKEKEQKEKIEDLKGIQMVICILSIHNGKRP